MLASLCPPAILYLGFSLSHIIIDIFKGMNNTAFFKFIVMVIFTLVLNILCNIGLGVVSWFIVFIPIILMTFITSMLLFVFGLSPKNGKYNYYVDEPTYYHSNHQKSHFDPKPKNIHTHKKEKSSPTIHTHVIDKKHREHEKKYDHHEKKYNHHEKKYNHHVKNKYNSE